MIAPPLTKNYSLVGTAFDYLMRFYFQHMYGFAQSKGWVAALAPLLVEPDTPQHKHIKQLLDSAKEHHKQYLRDGIATPQLLGSCIHLAQLDLVYRIRKVVPDLGKVDELDLQDLYQLVSAVDPALFHPMHRCLLNPMFAASRGIVPLTADADLIIDDMLIDIKTTKDYKFKQDHLNQLLGYYVMARAGGESEGLNAIRKLAVYSSRYAKLHTFDLEEMGTEQTFVAFTDWFVERAKQRPSTLERHNVQRRNVRRQRHNVQRHDTQGHDVIEKLTLISLAVDLPEHGLKVGAVGMVLDVYDDRKVCTVEFLNFGGDLVARVTLNFDQVQQLDSYT